MQFRVCVDDTSIMLAGLHHYSEASQLRRTIIDIQAVQVVFNDGLCSITVRPAVLPVNLQNNVKSIGQEVPGTDARIQHF